MPRWSVDDHLITLTLVFDELEVFKGGQRVSRVQLNGRWDTHDIPINGQVYRLTKLVQLVPTYELERVGAGFIPESLGFHPRVGAPPGSTCPTHQVLAPQACSRCGQFLCADCVALDRVHCAACFGRLEVEAQRLPRPYPYAAPAVLFGLIGGAGGVLVGLVAGLGAYAIARRIEARWLRFLVAFGAFAAAAGLLVVLELVLQTWLS